LISAFETEEYQRKNSFRVVYSKDWPVEKQKQIDKTIKRSALPPAHTRDASPKKQKKEEEMQLEIKGCCVSKNARKDGRYMGYLTENGVRTYVYGATKQEVIEKLQKYVKNGSPKKKQQKKTTVKQWSEKWFNAYKKPNLKPKSIESLEYCIRVFNARFSSVPLNALKPLDLQEFFVSLGETRRRDMVFAAIKEMLEKARKQGLIKTNPCESVELKRRTKKKRLGLTPEQTNTLLTAVKRMSIAGIFKLLLVSGIRIGEALALTPEDIKDGVLTVNKNAVYVKGEKIIQTPKTEAGTRQIPIPNISIELPINLTYSGVRAGFRRLEEKTGIKISPHILRHTYADRLEEAGVPPKVKQYLMGHSRLEITQDTYTDTQKHYIERYNTAILQAFSDDK